jgi:hypothetical protein
MSPYFLNRMRHQGDEVGKGFISSKRRKYLTREEKAQNKMSLEYEFYAIRCRHISFHRMRLEAVYSARAFSVAKGASI